MELQFHKTPMTCLKQVLSQHGDKELTQELRLPDGMPDVGAVIAAWGQILIRGKQWESDRVGVTGGVQIWVLYEPEDGSGHQCIEAWIPFEQDWDLDEPAPDGKIVVIPALRQVDARSVTPRKLMLKVSMNLFNKAYIADTIQLYNPDAMPEDVQLLIREHTFHVPTETGERTFTLDEEVTMPQDQPAPEKLIYCSLIPRINESKVMAGKLVFRGSCQLHVLYQSADGVHATDLEFPFAQYGDLEQDYDPEAQVSIYPVITNFEAELGALNALRMKAGLLAQYVVSDRKNIRLVQDAYSTQKQLKLQSAPLEMLQIIGSDQWNHHAKCACDLEGKPVDTVFYADIPKMQGFGEDRHQYFSGRFQSLYYDADGKLSCHNCKWEHSEPVAEDAICETEITVQHISAEEAVMDMTPVDMGQDAMEAVCDITVGDNIEKDPNAPSLIVRRMGHESLWELAKRTGSTVAGIQAVNGLDAEPEQGTTLILPVS